MKKLISAATIIFFLNLIGCYYQEQMNPNIYEFDEKEELQLTTKDTTYRISGNDYYFENDTLFATLSEKLNKQTTLKSNVKIPAEDIENVRIEKTDAIATTLTVFGVLVGVLGVIFLIGASSSSWIF